MKHRKCPPVKHHDDGVKILCSRIHETTKALLIDQDGLQVWIPKSQIKGTSQRSLVLPKWLVEHHHLNPYNKPPLPQ